MAVDDDILSGDSPPVLEIVYVPNGSGVDELVLLPGGNACHRRDLMRAPYIYYSSRKEALYGQAVSRLHSGVPLSNFKGSPYYSYYIKRLEKEHPEYLI